MRMQQNKTWINYLLTGIDLLFIYTLFFAIGCLEPMAEVRLDGDIIYRNQTDHLINYYHYNSSYSFLQHVFELNPNAEKKYEIRGSGPDTDLNNCCQGIFEDIQGVTDILIDYDNGQKCLVYLSGDGPTTANINIGYQSREISSKYYEFIYTFTEEEYNQATDCSSRLDR